MQSDNITVRKAETKDKEMTLSLYKALWQDADEGELEEIFSHSLRGKNVTTFLASLQGQAAGFAECSLRSDYVEGTATSPVGYLEGIFIKPEYRNKGLARELIKACEEWAKEKGCKEFASDCELHNEESRRFHMATGFDEANRIICFVKKI